MRRSSGRGSTIKDLTARDSGYLELWIATLDNVSSFHVLITNETLQLFCLLYPAGYSPDQLFSPMNGQPTMDWRQQPTLTTLLTTVSSLWTPLPVCIQTLRKDFGPMWRSPSLGVPTSNSLWSISCSGGEWMLLEDSTRFPIVSTDICLFWLLEYINWF